jgi:hypothetical protein
MRQEGRDLSRKLTQVNAQVLMGSFREVSGSAFAAAWLVERQQERRAT